MNQEEIPEGTGEGISQVPDSGSGKVDSVGGSKGVVYRDEFNTLAGLVRQMQSERDKRIDKQAKDIDEIRGILEQYQGYLDQGFSKERAVKEIQRDLDLEKLKSRVDTGVPRELDTASPGKQAQEDPVEAVVIGLGLDPNSQDVISILRMNASVTDKVSALGKLLGGKSAPESNPAGVVSTGLGPPPRADLMSEYQREVKNFRGDIPKVLEIQAKYRKLGLSI